jgi:hypothetical protein
MRNIDEYKKTTNRTIYNKARKCYLSSGTGKIHCGFCKYHKGENITHGYKKHVSWKTLTDKRKQWEYRTPTSDINSLTWWKGGYN